MKYEEKECVTCPGNGKIVTDPQGSYTGRPEEKEECPVQDVDDL